MSKMIQIRNVPEEVHRTLKVRAAEAGMSLSDYLNREIAQIAATPTLDEMLERLAQLPPIKSPVPIEELIREERESR